MKKGISIMTILAVFLTLLITTGCFNSESKEGMRVGFVNMNEAGLDELGKEIVEYGKKISEEKGFTVLQEELKKAEEMARNTPEAVALKEKIKPFLEAWEYSEKARGNGNTKETKVAEEKFQKLMSDKELMESYEKFHSIVDSDENVAVKRKEIAGINKEIGTEVNKKKTELIECFYQKIKIISSEIAKGKYGIVLGVTEFSSDGKKVSKKIEILYCDKNNTEDLTEKVEMRLKFFKGD